MLSTPSPLAGEGWGEGEKQIPSFDRLRTGATLRNDRRRETDWMTRQSPEIAIQEASASAFGLPGVNRV